MKQIFVIMQIGNEELDNVYKTAYVPAGKALEFEVKRVDKHNQGRLLKSEIVDYINSSEIIIADLTNERPNCYLEVGYAMGLGKFRNLILTAREDHYDRSPKYKPDGKRIHFDLSGYDIVFWSPDNIDKLKEDLIRKIKSRISIVREAENVTTPNSEWIKQNRDIAAKGLKTVGRSTYFEVLSTVSNSIQKSHQELLQASEHAQVHTFGWPIGVSLNQRPEYRTKPSPDGISAEITIVKDDDDESHYDYWSIDKKGDFHLIKSIFEDTRKPDSIFFDTRIMRVTEVFLYLGRLYYSLNIDPEAPVSISIKHSGIKGRFLRSGNPRRIGLHERIASSDEVETTINTTVGGLETDRIKHVRKVIDDLFVLFDFYQVDNNVFEGIVTNYVDGRVT